MFLYLHKFYVVYYYNQEGRIGLKLREDNCLQRKHRNTILEQRKKSIGRGKGMNRCE